MKNKCILDLTNYAFPTAYSMKCRTVGKPVNDELERMWQAAAKFTKEKDRLYISTFAIP
jgi:hypothetical protein